MKYRFDAKGHKHEISYNESVWQPLFGTTTLINEVYPPPLAWYGSAKALEPLGYIPYTKEPDPAKRRAALAAGLELMLELTEDETAIDRYERLLELCYKNHDVYKKSQGKKGTDKHAEIEKYVKDCIENRQGVPYQLDGLNFSSWAVNEVDHFLWSEANCYSEKLWVGGITDFGFVHKKGKTFIGDAKPSVYPKHFIQTAGYGIQIKENGLLDVRGTLVREPFAIDGYCIFDYNKGEARYLDGEWVGKLEDDFKHTVKMYERRTLIGSPTI